MNDLAAKLLDWAILKAKEPTTYLGVVVMITSAVDIVATKAQTEELSGGIALVVGFFVAVLTEKYRGKKAE